MDLLASGEPRLEIRVLGPVEIAWDGQTVDIGGAKARALVARLLIDRGLVISVDRLVDSLWGEQNAHGSRLALRSTISRVRRRLQAAGATDELIVTRAPGYLLDVPAEVTDAARFERLVAEGRRELTRRRPSATIRLLAAAEQLWRGPAYSEVRDDPFARAEARRLEELRLSATETRMDAGLTLGRHGALAGELESLTTANPLRERLWSQRMLALYRSGRQAEALRVFQDLRAILVAELGIEPGRDVTWMEHAILSSEPGLDFPVPPERPDDDTVVTAPASAESDYRVRVPALLHDTPFVGRDHESALVREWWASVRAGTGRLLLVEGDEGIGKTRLVAELARAVETDGTLVLWGRCDEDPVVPFQPFAEAFGHYYQSVSADQISRIPDWQLTELARLVWRLREYVPLADEEGGNLERDRFRFFEAVTATLSDLSAARPVLLVLDDAHWADQPTLLLLRHILRNTDEAGVGVIATYAHAEMPPEHPLRPVLTDLRSVHSVATVHLRGLSPSAVEQLTRDDGTNPPPSADLVARLCRVTDGNPLFLDELLRQLRGRKDEGGHEDGSPVPPDLSPTESIRELVARRVSRLPEDTVYLLQAAAVAGPECEADIVAEAAELSADRVLDAFDRAEESRLLRRVGHDPDRYAFSHTLVREAIYGELLRGRRVRYHHRIASALERVHADALDSYLNELAHHFSMGAALGDADKAVRYCRAAGERALRLLAFEEAVSHLTRGLEVAERHCAHDQATRCDILLALAEAQSRAGDPEPAERNFDRATSLARAMGDGERLAASAVRRGPLSYLLGSLGPTPDEVELLNEARDLLPEGDSHLRAMVTARLGFALVRAPGTQLPDDIAQGLALNNEAVVMARRLGDRPALGYALNARMSALWGVQPGAERLATAIELGEVAEEVGDELLALHGHMWRLRELLVRGDVDAVREEIERFEERDGGPVHPLEASFACNVAAVMAMLEGDFEAAEQAARQAMVVAQGYNELVRPFYGALMWWTWWQRGEFTSSLEEFRLGVDMAPAGYPSVRAAVALFHSEAGETEQALEELGALADIGWHSTAADLTEGASLAMAAGACSAVGEPAAELAASIYDGMRAFAGTAIVIRAPAVACVGPADQYLGLLGATMGDLALAEVHFEAALLMARRMESPPFVAAAEVELGRTLRRRQPEGEAERVAVLLRAAEESALAMGLHRLARRAAEPD
ncbi:MAG: ATP-binding protein [Acidimicrobiales bacterium]